MAQLIGTAPNQVPTNGDLGSAAFLDSSAFYGTGVSASFRNRIINGDMRVDQRNNGTAVSLTTGETYSVDRWFARCSAGSYTITQGRSTVAPPGFTNSFLVTTRACNTPY